MDEVNSLCSHFKNPMSNMKNERLNIMTRFFVIINNAYACVSVDADISTPAVKFLTENIKLKPILYWNKYEEQDKCDAIVVNDIDTIYNRIKQKMMDHKPVFVCSDSLTQLQERFVIPLKTDLGRSKLENYKIYSSKTDDSIMDDIKACFIDDKVYWIFTTPSLTYGIDINDYPCDIFGLYWNQSIHASSCVQQLNRIRKPLSITLWFAREYQAPTHDSIEEFRTTYEDSTNDTKTLRSLAINLTKRFDPNMIISYQNFVFETEYMEMRLMHLKFHVCDILRKKGHKVIYENIKKEKSKISKGNMSADIIRTLNKFIADGTPSKLLNQSRELLKVIVGDANMMLEDVLVNITTSPYTFMFQDILFKSAYRQFYFNYCVYTTHNSKDFKETIQHKSKNDIIYHVEKSDRYKIYLLKKMQKDLGIDDVFKFDLIDAISKCTDEEKTEIKYYKQCIKPFRLRGNQFSGKECKVDHYRFFYDCFYKVFSPIMKSHRQLINGKQNRYKIVTSAFPLENFRKHIADLQPKYEFDN